MSDIFLSYDALDTDKAYELSSIFMKHGWTVWAGSPNLPPGTNYDEVAEKELKGAKAIVVLWSVTTNVSPTMRAGLKRLSPDLSVIVLLDRGAAPLPAFPPIRLFDLSDWGGSAWRDELRSLLYRLYSLIPSASLPTAKPPASLEELSLSEIQESVRQGIRESEVTLPKDEARFKGIFISYRRNEAAAYAGRLYDRLAARFGKERVFIDTANVGVGKNFVKAIKAAAESCVAMAVLISREWLRAVGDTQDEEDDYVRLEVATALVREIPVIPITIQGASMPRRKDLPNDLAPLAHINAFELRDVRWERDVEDLIRDLEEHLNG